jgi:hypothetical protein
MSKNKDTLVISEIHNLDVDENTKLLLEEIFRYERDQHNRSDQATRVTNAREKIIRRFNRETA